MRAVAGAGGDADRAREEREKKLAYARELKQQMEEAKLRKEKEKLEDKMPAATSVLGAVGSGSPPPAGRRRSIPLLPVPDHDPNAMNAMPLAAQQPYYGMGQPYQQQQQPTMGGYQMGSPVMGQPTDTYPPGIMPLQQQASPQGYPLPGGGAFFGNRQGPQAYMMDSGGGAGRGFGQQQTPVALSQLELGPSPTSNNGTMPYAYNSPVQQPRGPGGFPRDDMFGASGGGSGAGGGGGMYGPAGLSPTWSSADQSLPFPSMAGGGPQPYQMQQPPPQQPPGGKVPRGQALKEIQVRARDSTLHRLMTGLTRWTMDGWWCMRDRASTTRTRRSGR